MTTKAEKLAMRRKKAYAMAGTQPDGAEIYHPKVGPGQVFVRELIGADTGHAKHYRNMAHSQLLLAFHRGKLVGPDDNRRGAITADDRKNCGERFANWWRTKQASTGQDSTVPRVSGGEHEPFTERQQIASNQIARVRGRMERSNYRLVEKFCGEDYSMSETLRLTGIAVYPSGRAFRIREALDDLVQAMTGCSNNTNASHVDKQPQRR